MTELSDQTLREILLKYKKNIGRVAWKEKEKILFELKSLYGNSFNKDKANEIYENIKDNKND